MDRQHRDFSRLRRHAKVHSFRIITAAPAWVFIGVAFYYRPDWIKWGLRTATHGNRNRPSRTRRVHLDSDHSPDHIHSCGLFDYRDGVAVPERMTLEGAPKRNPSPVWRLLRYETRPV